MNMAMTVAPLLLCSNTPPTERRLSAALLGEKEEGMLLLPPLHMPMFALKEVESSTSIKLADRGTYVSKAVSIQKEQAIDKHHAARVIQRCFRGYLQAYQRQEQALRAKLQAIQLQTQSDLERIAVQKERRKIELLLEVGMESRGELAVEIQHSEQVLQESRESIDELTCRLKLFKKSNAFLQRRCKALKRRNRQLRLERRKQSQLKKKARLERGKMEEGQVILTHYQNRVCEETARVQEVNAQLDCCKSGNRRIRQVMGRMVRLVEEREEEEDVDKWDLVDKLYQIQRDTQQKRRSYNTPILSCGRGHKRVHSLPTDMKRALADCPNMATTSQ
ncbi:expressed unknown protein [Seminavis robusta]|uniref:Uncharacterized protein n=1 Tax=Seminavis robusta TaxID=568900 RepID=A0A9N8H629_9STRA|nr:expressed unknown protein [Seminavis robusta]|eukprot:Sro35_g022460.1 n/a (334) ;mRNA; r:102570-103571